MQRKNGVTSARKGGRMYRCHCILSRQSIKPLPKCTCEKEGIATKEEVATVVATLAERAKGAIGMHLH
jgi:hypothetical protein